MKKQLKNILFVIVIFLYIITLTGCTKKENNDSEIFKVVTSFYPIQIIVQNLTQGAENIEVITMADNNVGCIHDYTLTTKDLKKLEKADLFIMNGLGLENFTEKILDTYSNITIVDSSKLITDSILKTGEENNPHIWTSIKNYLNQIKEIKEELINNNPENKEIYELNAQKYEEKLKQLQENYEYELSSLKGKKALCLNEAVAYLGNEVGLELLSIDTNHEESSLSAEELKNIVEKMKVEKINIILIGEEDNTKNAQTISDETGAKIYKIKDGLSGDGTNDSYYEMMLDNLETLKQVKS